MSCAHVKIHDERAVVPTRGTDDSVGYDLTIISVSKILGPKTIMYDTGISVKPPHGYYFEIVPRSSFSKSGHVLANSIGIIDPDYRGTLRVVVMRVDDSAEKIPLPYTGFQLILRRKHDTTFVVSSTLDETNRGDGGFGSTDAIPFQSQ